MTRAFERLSAAELSGWLAHHPGALLLDARDAGQYAQGHLPGSLRLDGRNHETLLLREDKARPVLIYCYHGNASQTYAQMFADFGFGLVADLIGGWTAWQSWQAAQTAPTRTDAAASATAQGVPSDLAFWLATEGFDPARPAAPGRHGNTPLMHAAWRGAADMLSALLDHGVPLDACNDDGNTALWLACVHGEPGPIRTLVARGVPIDHQNAVGATCLMYAASAGKAGVVETLLQLGANPHLTSQDDFSALDMAATAECLQLLRAATRRAA
jgi:rhodanese-related sulfurtransferase